MTLQNLKRLAVASLAISIAAIAYSVHLSLTAEGIFGPGALRVVPGGEVWVSVDRQLWRADAQGHLLATTDWVALGLPGEPANLVRHPDGTVVATVRDNATLFFLDPATARVARTLQPRWPADLVQHGGRAINLAFHGDGRFAIATGGGHAVALFGADGQFLARTPPDMYRFTNGLWWAGGTLWTTDTNRTQLKRLDGTNLALLQTVQLPLGTAAYLGPARLNSQDSAAGQPMAGLIRYVNGMIRGTATLIDREGRETRLATSEHFEPHDIEWLAGELLVSDGDSFSVKRWSATGTARAPFGDAAMQTRLHDRLRLRDFQQQRHRVAVWAAIGAFAIAALLIGLAKRQESRQQGGVDMSGVGTPQISHWQMARLELRLIGPPLGMMLPVFAFQPAWVKDAFRGLAGKAAPLIGVGVLLLLYGIAVWFLSRRQKRLIRLPEFEPLFNLHAMRRLRAGGGLPQLLREGERVRETFSLSRLSPRWAVLTDERLLLFKPSLLEVHLENDIPLDRIVVVSTEPGTLMAGRQSWFAGKGSRGNWIEFALRDGTVVSGAVPCVPLAERVVERLSRHASLPTVRAKPGKLAPATPPLRPAHVWASALLPGLGQWMQGRGGSALLLFVPWLVLLLFVTIPVIWVLAGPRAEVSPRELGWVVGLHLLLAGIAALDVWRSGARREPD